MEEKRFITEEGLKKLEEELAKLKEKRKEIAQRIQGAKELGDLSENAEYIEARDSQAFNEGRIIELENIIKNAVIVNGRSRSKTIQVGSRIKVKSLGGDFSSQNQTESFSIVGSNEARPAEGKISNESPLGRAFVGHKAGETVEVEAPRGKIKYKIVAIE